LHAHVTELQPGGGYDAHADKYDVAIIVFSGTVETLGKTLGPGGSVYYAAGQRHGMRNVGKESAKYLVFEFHGPNASRKAARRHAAEPQSLP
jgi:quercetin dioxygenase-like cupin family protein